MPGVTKKLGVSPRCSPNGRINHYHYGDDKQYFYKVGILFACQGRNLAHGANTGTGPVCPSRTSRLERDVSIGKSGLFRAYLMGTCIQLFWQTRTMRDFRA